jgi:hypothetical protein
MAEGQYAFLDEPGNQRLPRRVTNRLANANMAADRLNINLPQRMGGGGGAGAQAQPLDFDPANPQDFRNRYGNQLVELESEPGEYIAGSIAPLWEEFAGRFDMDLTQGYGGESSPSVSSGHTTYGTSLDVAPASGDWDGKFAKGLQLLTNLGFMVGYDGSIPGTETWSGHGEGDHAHIEFVQQPDYAGDPAATTPDARKRLREVLLNGRLPEMPDIAGSIPVGGSADPYAAQGAALVAAGAPAGIVGAAVEQAQAPPAIPISPIQNPLAVAPVMPMGYQPVAGIGAPSGEDDSLLDMLTDAYAGGLTRLNNRRRPPRRNALLG